MKSAALSLSCLLASLVAVPILSGQSPSSAPVQIGMVQTLFTDVPTPVVNLLMPPFRQLMKQFTSIDGQIVLGGDCYDVAQKLDESKIQLAVFHGVEFGWAQQKYSDLRPFMIAVYKTPQIRAHLIVKDDGGATELAGLKGKLCAVPFRSREHCRLFLEKQCATVSKGSPASYFEKVTKPMSAESAMDEVLTGKVAAAVIDEVLYENYRDVKPGCFARLRVLSTSEVFPSAVVAYKQGAVSDEMLNRFRTGMANANQNERGRDLMNLWKITSFEAAPADFGETVANIVKAYPAPVSATTASRTP
jgi:ABC-type phosphate/phosphonate transport system substrate-binding protein